ncbi:MAG: ATP-binding cassette domain-containing protein, partial [Spirochaetaceae bacterium]|nr:ATP-binding cassette domain-containing protein [Spirochaetaceae bacterium]
MAKVELKSISKVYDGNVRAMDKANITVNDKEFVVFVGPSGCGKSTTLR